MFIQEYVRKNPKTNLLWKRKTGYNYEIETLMNYLNN